jgi:hypothetical protein
MINLRWENSGLSVSSVWIEETRFGSAVWISGCAEIHPILAQGGLVLMMHFIFH